MSTASDAADQVVRESIQITEASVKLAAVGAKNLAALLLALSKDQQKLKGKTSLQRLLREGRELKVFRLKSEDLHTFHQEARKYGVLYSPVLDKKSATGLCNLLVKAEDVAKINHILEQMGHALPAEIKKNIPNQSVNKLSGQNPLQSPALTTTNKPSVRSRLDACKAMSGQSNHNAQERVSEQIR